MISSGRKKEIQSNRRCNPRLKPEDVPFLKRVELYQGKEIQIVNISSGGLLIETETCLRPDFKIMLTLVTTEGVYKLDGTILRSSISSLNGKPKYRTAIAFKQPFEPMDVFKDESTEPAHETLSEDPNYKIQDKADGNEGQQDSPESEKEKDPAILTVIASSSNGVHVQESFELNDW
ncbi:MAG: PilZ domain-containing protein [Acidobacteriota bacterium]|jgi:hypothetical protein